MLAITNAAVSLNERIVCNNLSLTLMPRQLVWVYGDNGAGKTTLLRVLAGLYTSGCRITGTIRCDGKHGDWRTMRPLLWRQVSFVHTTPYLLATTVANNCRRFADDEASVATALERFDLTTRADADAQQLSTGQQKRLALARAFASGARYVLCDEPLHGLDGAAQAQFFAAIRAYQYAVLMTAHTPPSAHIAVDCTVVLRDGICSDINK